MYNIRDISQIDMGHIDGFSHTSKLNLIKRLSGTYMLVFIHIFSAMKCNSK